jgi:hypothetical protein
VASQGREAEEESDGRTFGKKEDSRKKHGKAEKMEKVAE